MKPTKAVTASAMRVDWSHGGGVCNALGSTIEKRKPAPPSSKKSRPIPSTHTDRIEKLGLDRGAAEIFALETELRFARTKLSSTQPSSR